MTTSPAPDLRHREHFRYLERLRVRWAEVDMQKIVFNGHYLMYFDTAVAGYWRALALPYHETMVALAGDLFVRKATVEYEGSAHYDDLCEVGARCQRIGRSSMIFGVALFRGETRLVHGELVYVFADPATQSSRPVPSALREVLEGYEAGAPMVECRVGTWADLGRDAAPLRRAVFEAELGVQQPMDEDPADAQALQVVAYNRLGAAVATGRVVMEGVTTRFAGEAGASDVMRIASARRADGTSGGSLGRIGRLAVHGALRGSGIGAVVADALVAAARARGSRELVLAAQASAVGFWERAGFVAHGARFEEAGQPHQEMRRAL